MRGSDGLVWSQPGGILAVGGVVFDRWGDLHADLSHHYPGVEPGGIWRRPGDPGFIGVRSLADLLLRLPDEAWVRTTPQVRDQLRRARLWGTEHELAAQQVELLSVIASDMRLRKPREVPRPDWTTGRSDPERAAAATAHAVNVLRQTRRMVRTHTG